MSTGAREVAGTEVSVYQVPELVPADILEKSGAKAARAAFATGGLWMSGALVGKVGSVFTNTASQHGGQERMITSCLCDDTAYLKNGGTLEKAAQMANHASTRTT